MLAFGYMRALQDLEEVNGDLRQSIEEARELLERAKRQVEQLTKRQFGSAQDTPLSPQVRGLGIATTLKTQRFTCCHESCNRHAGMCDAKCSSCLYRLAMEGAVARQRSPTQQQ